MSGSQVLGGTHLCAARRFLVLSSSCFMSTAVDTRATTHRSVLSRSSAAEASPRLLARLARPSSLSVLREIHWGMDGRGGEKTRRCIPQSAMFSRRIDGCTVGCTQSFVSHCRRTFHPYTAKTVCFGCCRLFSGALRVEGKVSARVVGGGRRILERLLVSIETSNDLTPSTGCKANMRARGSCGCVAVSGIARFAG